MNKLITALLLLVCQMYGDEVHFSDRDPQYHIQKSDQLDLSFRYTPEYDQTLQVQPDGYVAVKLVGNVKVAGLTIEEACSRLRDALKARLHDPEITLTPKEFVRPSYIIAGQVGTPGKYELHGDITAVEAIAVAGGFKDSAKHSQVILYRHVSPDLAQTRLIDIKRLIDPKHPHLQEDVKLQAGDLLVIPKNRVSKISDYVHWVNIGSYIPM